MDDASSKNGVKKSTLTEASTKNTEKMKNGPVKLFDFRLFVPFLCVPSSDMMSSERLSPQQILETSLQKNLAC
jgi:hypothetical protein